MLIVPSNMIVLEFKSNSLMVPAQIAVNTHKGLLELR